ncbi:hypothetical protein BGZ83_000457 [Gryganskiella cystojenkinii]|nr:hypothetical protein BGZ83_000457 [Gryganskiella cystojenkinii]
MVSSPKSCSVKRVCLMLLGALVFTVCLTVPNTEAAPLLSAVALSQENPHGNFRTSGLSPSRTRRSDAEAHGIVTPSPGRFETNRLSPSRTRRYDSEGEAEILQLSQSKVGTAGLSPSRTRRYDSESEAEILQLSQSKAGTAGLSPSRT